MNLGNLPYFLVQFSGSTVDHAGHLNAICSPARWPKVFYDALSGGLVWSDETKRGDTPVEVIWALRLIVAYRTSLMLNKPREGFQPLWEQAQALFPKWVGFRPERRQPSTKLMAIYRRGHVSLEKCMRGLERQMDAEDAEKGRTSDRSHDTNVD